MTTANERQKDILSIISTLDITPTMFQNANEKYHALASFLENNGIHAEIYPQGSFALGTVVRPVIKDPDAAYDLDFICQFSQNRDQISPKELRKSIENVLKSSDLYSDKLTVYDECFTIEYADIGSIKFSIDIVPAANETFLRKQEMVEKSFRADLIETSIAIPRQDESKNYSWITNNPRGFRKWFEEINQPFLEHNRDIRRNEIFKNNRANFDSVDSVPAELERSSMQRVIQLLKYHRDVYYLNLKRENSDDLKPISAIINTLVATISKGFNSQSNTFELLNHVLSELSVYAEYQTLDYDSFISKYGKRSFISQPKLNKKWVINNPANPEDNLADKWNENNEIPQIFFKWVKFCKADLIDSLSLSDSQFRSTMENAFRTDEIQKNWADKYKDTSRENPYPITSSPKPYRS